MAQFGTLCTVARATTPRRAHRLLQLTVAVASLAMVATACSSSKTTGAASQPTGNKGEIVIGVITEDQGPAAAGGADAVRGVQLALKDLGDTIDGKKIRLVVEGTDQTGPSADAKVRKLVEQEGAQIVIGSNSGDEGLAISNFAPKHPEVTFMDAIAAAQGQTTGKANVFRFAYGDGAQWVAGLGKYAYDNMNLRKVAVVSDNYSFAWAQVAGFNVDFCAAGGQIPKRIMLPLGTTAYDSIVTQIPTNVDALYLVLNGADSLNFLKAYTTSGGHAKIIASSITVDQTVLSAKGDIQNSLVGVISASPVADNIPGDAWKNFVAEYRAAYPNAFASPSVFSAGNYANMSAIIEALKAVNGDLSDGQKKFQAALGSLKLAAPSGEITIDSDRNGMFPVYITKVTRSAGGTLGNSVVATLPAPAASYYQKQGMAGPATPKCVAG